VAALVDDDGVGQPELELQSGPQRACGHHQAAETAAAVDDGDVRSPANSLQAVIHDDDGTRCARSRWRAHRSGGRTISVGAALASSNARSDAPTSDLPFTQ
jgi:hypothetical protein